MSVRVRFAPSPTGALHIGGIRTALYNYLFAKQNNGQLIIRIEDTDEKRYVPEAEQYIIDSLKWVGIEFDESPEKPNPKYGKFRQSEREYSIYSKQLIDSGHAYYAFDSAQELDQIRADYKKMGKIFMYNVFTRNSMQNSLTLSAEEVKLRLDRKDPYVIRFKVPRNEQIVVNDLIRGKIKFESNTLDDKVLVKETGTPTYHLANIVDDHLMEISHVIRGEEWLPSLAIHSLLYSAFGWKSPEFAHLNLILNPDGKGKLSKRSAIKNGFSVFPLTASTTVDDVEYVMEGYKEKGYEPEAVINFLALLGWSLKGNKEIASIQEMIEEFDLNKLSKAGSRFDLNKLDWFNSEYVKKIQYQEIINSKKYLGKEDLIMTFAKDRAVFRKDLYNVINIFYSDIESYSDIEKITDECKSFFKIALTNFPDKDFKQELRNLAEQNNIKFVKIMPGLRQALTGRSTGPELGVIMDILGKEEILKRIERVI